MNLPRFSADQALGATLRRHAMSTNIAAHSHSAIEPQLSVGGGGSGGSCIDAYQSCYIDCSVRYPESGDSASNLNAEYRQACYDSCDAAYRLCNPGAAGARIGWNAGQLRGAGPRIGR